MVTGEQETERQEITTGLSDGLVVEVTSGIDTTQKIRVQLDPKAKGDDNNDD